MEVSSMFSVVSLKKCGYSLKKKKGSVRWFVCNKRNMMIVKTKKNESSNLLNLRFKFVYNRALMPFSLCKCKKYIKFLQVRANLKAGLSPTQSHVSKLYTSFTPCTSCSSRKSYMYAGIWMTLVLKSSFSYMHTYKSSRKHKKCR